MRREAALNWCPYYMYTHLCIGQQLTQNSLVAHKHWVRCTRCHQSAAVGGQARFSWYSDHQLEVPQGPEGQLFCTCDSGALDY